MTVNHSSLSIQLGRRIPASDSSAISKYIKNISTMNKSTAYMYFTRLSSFKSFISSAFNLQIDVLIKRIKEGSIDVFDVLNEYAAYLSNTNISSITIKQLVVTVKNFFEYHDIDIGPRKFRLKVKLPKTIRKNKEALSKEDIIEILNACSDIRLKMYVMFLAAGGFIGHSGSTYWRKKDSEKGELFRRIEPYLTFLNVHQLERQGADIQSKVEELEDLNQSLRNHDNDRRRNSTFIR